MDKHPITLQQQRKVWSIHTSVRGLTYYYNKATKKSQYEMPQCFKTTQQVLEHPQWKQYKNADGKKFYYNSVTRKSVWHLPNEVKQWRAKMQQTRRQQRLNQKDNEQEELLNVTDQMKKKFVQLLREKNINVNTKWDACMKLCEEEERWKAVKISEKKKIFQDYIEELKRQEDLQKRAKLEAHKANFLKMLMEHKELTSDCKMHKIISDFAPDPRWRALDETERENVYQMYMDELLNKEKQQAKIKKKEHLDGLRKMMEDHRVSHKMKWDEFRAQFANNEHFKGLHNYDRLNKFTQYILQQEKKYEQQQHRDKQMKEKKNRDALRQLIQKRMRSGHINHKTRWVRFVKDNKDQKSLIDMMDPNQQGSSPHEMFEDLMEGIRQYHKQFKSQIKQHFKQSGFRMSVETTQETFEEKLKGLDIFWTLRPVLRDYFYHYFKNKIKSKGGKKSKKETKKLLIKVFKHIKELKPKSQLSDFMPKIQQELKLLSLDHPIPQDTISKYFTQYTTDLDPQRRRKRQRSESKSDSDSSQDQKRKKKKKRRGSDSSDEEDKPPKKQKKQQPKETKAKEQAKEPVKLDSAKKQIEKKQIQKKEQIQTLSVPKPADDGEEGEIKDQDVATDKDKYKSHSKRQKKKHRSRSRRRSNSSDS